ncbi:Calcium-binding protein [Actinidia chinensis var. chinensis]|uniref:Calcium-binding protein n=1 Tax=Actinidia chinensis var. chinensis TaxID=1590841 RepID=A0A2R6RZ49_ACTCC|nr:Calcium-binding protein [Actinidia chinensis var. chinensis]
MEIISKQYERVFNHFDEDGNGRISPRELHICVGSLGGDLSESEAEAAVGLVDSDGDGELGLEDFVRLMEGTKEEEEKVEELREAFKMYEMVEGCGCITPKSLQRVLGRLGQAKTMDECKSMIAHFDLNGDGVLNFDEFMIMMT